MIKKCLKLSQVLFPKRDLTPKFLAILTISIIILFSGCSIKEYTLFQNEDPTLNQPQELNITFESRILPDDILNIDIYNLNQRSNMLGDSNILDKRTSVSKKENIYIVESDGTIYLPLIKEVRVEGFTAQELSKELTKRYARYLRDPYAKVRIQNHRIYVFGEVYKQGLIHLAGNSMSILEVLSKSGGLTTDAVLNRIRVISKINGKNMLRTLNLRKLSTLNIDNLMIGNNSIVYVEPRSSKAYRLGINNYLPMISAIGSISGSMLNINSLKRDSFYFNTHDSSSNRSFTNVDNTTTGTE
jgi:polysaccharide export outer membrane protein